MILSMVKRLRDRLNTTPDDTEGWLRLARAYDVLGNLDAAFNAYLDSAPNDMPLLINFLNARLEWRCQPHNSAWHKLFWHGTTSANGPQYLFFKGHMARVTGDIVTARSVWTELLSSMPAESEMAAALAAEIAKLN